MSTEAPERTLLWHARWTVPAHVILGGVAWWMATADLELAANAFLGLHIAFAVVFMATAKWWWSRFGEVAALVVVNHLATWATLWATSVL